MEKNYILFILLLILGIAMIFINMALPTETKNREEDNHKLILYKNLSITLGIIMVVISILYLYSKWACDCGNNALEFLNRGLNFYLLSFIIIGILLIILYTLIIMEMRKLKIEINWIPITFLLLGILTIVIPSGYYIFMRNNY